MAEQSAEKMSWDVIDEEGNTVTTIHVTDNKPKTYEQFTSAFQRWQSGKEVQGYTFLKPGAMSTLRGAFNTVLQPVQQRAQALDEGIRRLRNVVGEKTGLYDPTSYGTGIPQALAGAVATPEDTLTTVASIAGGPFVNRASGALSMLRQAVLTGGAQFAGKQVFGANSANIGKNLTESAMVAVLGAGTQGIAGALKGVFHRGVDEQAQKEAAKQIVDKFKQANKGLTYDPVTLEAWASTPQGLRDIVQIGVGSLRGELNTVTTTVMKELKPGRLPVGVQNTIRAQLRRLEVAGRDFLHATDINDINTAQAAMDGARQAINAAVSSSPAGSGVAARLPNVMTSFNQRLDQFRVSAQMLNTLRESGAETGFNAVAFQRLVADKFMKTGPNSLAAQIGRAAFRGADPSAGTDVAVRTPNIASLLGLQNVPVLKHLSLSAPAGQKYVGKIPGTLPRTTGAAQAVAIPTIREYLQKEK